MEVTPKGQRDHKYHNGSLEELLSACIEGKKTEKEIITVHMFWSVRLK